MQKSTPASIIGVYVHELRKLFSERRPRWMLQCCGMERCGMEKQRS